MTDVRQANEANDVPRLDGIHVLVVDDLPEQSELLCLLLQSHGALPKAVASALQALDVIRTAWVDVVICDIVMPQHDGFAFVDQLQALPDSRSASLPVIALTARTLHRQEWMPRFVAYLQKPVNPSVLAATIRHAARMRASPIDSSNPNDQPASPSRDPVLSTRPTSAPLVVVRPPQPCPRCGAHDAEWQAHASPSNGGYDHFKCRTCGYVWPVRKGQITGV